MMPRYEVWGCPAQLALLLPEQLTPPDLERRALAGWIKRDEFEAESQEAAKVVFENKYLAEMEKWLFPWEDYKKWRIARGEEHLIAATKS